MCQLEFIQNSDVTAQEVEARVVLVLDDNHLEECQLHYFCGNKKIEIDEINKKFFQLGFQDEETTYPWKNFCRYFGSDYVYQATNLNYSIYHHKKNETVKSRKTLPISIETNYLLRGLFDMITLGSSWGGYTPLYIRYQNKEEQVTKSRNSPYNNESKKVLYDFAHRNHITLEGVDIGNLNLEEFILLFDYVDIHLFYSRIKNYIGPEIYGDALYQKVKMLIKNR